MNESTEMASEIRRGSVAIRKSVCERLLLAVSLGLKLPTTAQVAEKVGDVRFSEPVRLHTWQLDTADKELLDWVNKQVRVGVVAVARESSPSATAAALTGAVDSSTGGARAGASVADSCREISRSSRLLFCSRTPMGTCEVRCGLVDYSFR